MAGLSVAQFAAVYGPSDGPTAVSGPVLYEVWREHAVRGPAARLRLILRPHDDRNSRPVATRLQAEARRADESDDTDRPQLLVGAAGDWLVIEADLKQLITIVLPFTPWGPLLAGTRTLSANTIISLLEPLDDLLTRRDADVTTSDGRDPGSTRDDDSFAPPAVPFGADEADTASWFLRLFARMWGFDPDLDSERVGAVPLLRDLLLATGDPLAEPSVDMVTLDRRATIASSAPAPAATMLTSVSMQVVKADAARRLFEIDTSDVEWAVLDSGINALHPAFRAPAGAALPTRVTETYDLMKLKDEDLALANKEGPLDGLVRTVLGVALPAYDGTADGGYEEPTGTHGTHVAGILAGAVTDLYEGMCPQMRLWDFRVLDRNASGSESRILMALRYIRYINEREGRIRIAGVNMSLSLPYDPRNHACGWTPVCEEVRRLVRSGVVVVVASGNAGFRRGEEGHLEGGDNASVVSTKGTGFEMVSITDPGNTDEAITVGATHTQHPHRYGTSYFSGKGPTADGRRKPDLLAPGEGIFGPVGSIGWKAMNGTSQATPHVSGAAALLLARYPELVGEPAQVKDILCRTATDLGRDHSFQGHGLVDVLRAAQSI